MKIKLHKNDLPDGLDLGQSVAIDTETLGLNPHRDRLCLVQLTSGDNTCHMVQFDAGAYAAPNLKRMLVDPSVLKLFHFARFDLGMLAKTFGVMAAPVYCTKIASRLARTYTDKHGLKDLAREVLGIDLSKQQQLSDWGAEALTEAQVAYAADDVLNLHALRERLDVMLAREGRTELAAACFGFMPVRALQRQPRAGMVTRLSPCNARNGARHHSDRMTLHALAVDASPGRRWRWSIESWSPWRWTIFHSPSSRR